MQRRDPLANPERLIRRVYAYVAYRLGDGPEAEDVTSATFERALRYRSRYDARRGEPLSWLLGIARRCIADVVSMRREELPTSDDQLEPLTNDGRSQNIEEDTVLHLTLISAMSTLPKRERELLALRYGADLTARQIATIMNLGTSAVEVALHRALPRLRAIMEANSAAQPADALGRAQPRRPAGSPTTPQTAI